MTAVALQNELIGRISSIRDINLQSIKENLDESESKKPEKQLMKMLFLGLALVFAFYFSGNVIGKAYYYYTH
jgi:hypothetical protein